MTPRPSLASPARPTPLPRRPDRVPTPPWFRRWAGGAFAGVALAAASTAAAADAPRRVVSTSVCADAYVLALADPDAVAALSWQVDHAISGAPPWARAKPKAWASAERLLTLAPDLVVFDPGGGGRAAAWADRFVVAHISLAWAEDFDGVAANLRALGAALGADAAADAAIADLDRRKADLAARAAARGGDRGALYLTPAGGSAGAGVYVDAALTLAGARNRAAEAGLSGWGKAPLETLFAAPPDLLVTSYFRNGYPSAGNLTSRARLHRRAFASAPRLQVPGAAWPCAGPRLIDAAEMIADALDGLAPDSAGTAK